MKITTATLVLGLLSCYSQSHAERYVDEPRFILAWGQRGDKPGDFHSPIQIVISRKDEVYVTDLNNARVQKFTSTGQYLGGFDLPLDAPPRKSCIIGGLAVDRDGLIYLSFMNQNKIAVYTDSGRLVREWGKLGSLEGDFHQPGGIVICPDRTLFVTDQCNHRVQKFTLDGTFLGTWGGYGSEPGRFGAPEASGSRFAGPHFLSRDRKGRLYTTEAAAGRVQQLTPEGKPLLVWGDKGDQPGGFGVAAIVAGSKTTYGPIGILVDKRDRVWVSSLNHRVQLFTKEGKFLFGLGGLGTQPGQFTRPHGMAVDSKGFLYVADSGNQRIQKFSIPK